MNLGSPDSPAVRDVRRFLREFLMDGKVLDVSYLVRFFLVHFLILPVRPKASAEAYRKIWLPEGSPLVVISKKVREKLQARLDVPVELLLPDGHVVRRCADAEPAAAQRRVVRDHGEEQAGRGPNVNVVTQRCLGNRRCQLG